jgi:hypothetical protein
MMTVPTLEPELEEVRLSDFDWIGDLCVGGSARVNWTETLRGRII